MLAPEADSLGSVRPAAPVAQAPLVTRVRRAAEVPAGVGPPQPEAARGPQADSPVSVVRALPGIPAKPELVLPAPVASGAWLAAQQALAGSLESVVLAESAASRAPALAAWLGVPIKLAQEGSPDSRASGAWLAAQQALAGSLESVVESAASRAPALAALGAPAKLAQAESLDSRASAPAESASEDPVESPQSADPEVQFLAMAIRP